MNLGEFYDKWRSSIPAAAAADFKQDLGALISTEVDLAARGRQDPLRATMAAQILSGLLGLEALDLQSIENRFHPAPRTITELAQRLTDQLLTDLAQGTKHK